MQPLSRRLVASAWLLAWLSTPVVSLAILIHLASDHQHDQPLSLELAFAATHGHSHQASFAAHEHAAVREAAPSPLPELVAAAHEPTGLAGPSQRARSGRSDTSPPTESPPLFYRHCALLL